MKNAPCRNIQSLLHEGRRVLRKANLPLYNWDALILLSSALKREKEFVLAHPEQVVSARRISRFENMILARQRGVPVQYLCGVQEFWGREFQVDESVLIPRPETELIIDKALCYQGVLNELAGHKPVQVADIGTGSGCLAITLALEFVASRVFAVDVSPAAIRTARRNARRLCSQRSVRFLSGDTVDPLKEIVPRAFFHLVVSNPPYIALRDKNKLDPQVREQEPPEALYAGPDGLRFIRKLVPAVTDLLVPGGLFLMEIGWGQQEKVKSLFPGKEWSGVKVWQDLNGIPRCVEAWRKGC